MGLENNFVTTLPNIQGLKPEQLHCSQSFVPCIFKMLSKTCSCRWQTSSTHLLCSAYSKGKLSLFTACSSFIVFQPVPARDTTINWSGREWLGPGWAWLWRTLLLGYACCTTDGLYGNCYNVWFLECWKVKAEHVSRFFLCILGANLC